MGDADRPGEPGRAVVTRCLSLLIRRTACDRSGAPGALILARPSRCGQWRLTDALGRRWGDAAARAVAPACGEQGHPATWRTRWRGLAAGTLGNAHVTSSVQHELLQR